MSDIFKLYSKFRNNDKKNIGMLPLENRIVLSKLITNSSADRELKYVWINRAVAQASCDNSTAILGLFENDINEYKELRALTLQLRKKQNIPIPFEIKNNEDFKEFIKKCKKNYIIIKQNYPNYKNEEYNKIKELDFGDLNVINANSEEGNYIIGANECLERLYQRNSEWIDKNIEDYISYFYKKNNIEIIEKEYKMSIDKIKNLTKSLLIPIEFYCGDIEGLRNKIKELIKTDFYPVLKFSDSISGYGVHYPKDFDGNYSKKEINKYINSDEEFLEYLVDSFNKNGQEIDKKFIEKNINNKGIMLQKFIHGKDYAIGLFKPLKIYKNDFKLNIIDITLSEVLTDGTAHYADVIHREKEYLNEILKNTEFKFQEDFLYFAVEIIIYLLYLNENIIRKPDEFENINFEDFGIQFMVDDKTGEVGLIEINGRTPSHNLNFFNLISTYGYDYNQKTINNKILCTGTKIIEMKKLNKIFSNEDLKTKFVDNLIIETTKEYNGKLKIICFQKSGNQLVIYYNYYLGNNDVYNMKMNEITEFFKDNINNFIKSINNTKVI